MAMRPSVQAPESRESGLNSSELLRCDLRGLDGASLGLSSSSANGGRWWCLHKRSLTRAGRPGWSVFREMQLGAGPCSHRERGRPCSWKTRERSGVRGWGGTGVPGGVRFPSGRACAFSWRGGEAARASLPVWSESTRQFSKLTTLPVSLDHSVL